MAGEACAVHPGRSVRDLLRDTGLSVIEAATRLSVSRQQLTRLVGEKSGVSPEMALRIESVFGVPANELLALQAGFDLEQARKRARGRLSGLKAHDPAVKRRDKDFVLRRLRARQRELRSAGIDHLYLFGSVARGEANAASDVDLYFEQLPAAAIGLLEIATLQRRIEEILGMKADLAPGDSFRPHVRASVDRDAVFVF